MKTPHPAAGLTRRTSRTLLALFTLSLVPLVARATPPLCEQTDVFTAGQDGVTQYRIPGLLTTNQGTLLAFCDARLHRPGDPPNDIDLVLKRSDDGGRTWGPLRTLVDNGEGAVADSCGVVDRITGTIWIFSVYAPPGVGSANAAPGLTGATFQYKAIRSDDDGRTWSAPIDVTAMVKRPTWGAGSTGVGRGLQLSTGRLIIPRYYAAYRRPGPEPVSSASYVSYSDDHGRTWKMGALVPTPGGTNECQAAELADGTLLLNMRGLHGHHRLVARSHDGGETWTEVREDAALVEPPCQGSLLGYPAKPGTGTDRILFANPASEQRRNFTIRLSEDGGRTWPVARVLHPGPAAYSCLTELRDGTIGGLYECGDRDPYEKITFVHFNLAWLTGGREP